MSETPKDNVLTAMLKGILTRSGVTNRFKKDPTGKRMTIQMNHHDERTTSQLEAANFSGMRANDMWNRFEIWILGRRVETVSYQQFWLNPNSLNETYCQVFGLNQIQWDEATQRDIKRIAERAEEQKELERKL